MCILLSTTNHPDYPIIFLSNRDEYYRRPTKLAHYRTINDHERILSPLDMCREEHGTWLGVTTSGKVAILVNYRELEGHQEYSKLSRGILPIAYLTHEGLDEEWVDKISGENFHLGDIGGFSLVFGKLQVDSHTKKINHLNIISNRGHRGKIFLTEKAGDNEITGDIGFKTTFGLSNSLYYDPWQKVKLGEGLLQDVVNNSIRENYDLDRLVEESFKVLSHDTYDPKIGAGTDFAAKFKEVQNTIFVPPLATGLPSSPTNLSIGNYYGTRTQTIILIDKYGNMHYYERDLHDTDDYAENPNVKISHFTFDVHEQ